MNGRALRPRSLAASGGALALALGLAAAGCGSHAAGPTWQHLAAGHVPPPLAPLLVRWQGEPNAPRFRADEKGGGLWVETPLSGLDWHPGSRAGEWRSPRPPELDNRTVQDERLELLVDELHLALRATSPSDAAGAWIAPGELCVFRPDHEGAPADVRRALWFERGPARGAAQGAAGRVAVRLSVGEALAVWPGERVERFCDVPAGSVLRFRTRTHGFPAGGPVTYRVLLDDAPLFEHQEDSALAAPASAFVIQLGHEAHARARFAFEVSGAPAATSFFAPVVGPAEVGRPGARPWSETRPDLVLFLADTFRADLLADFGGDGTLTPALDALARRSVRFLDARSTSSWTLPAHASLFTGLWPTQHGAEQDDHTFSPELLTLAERLSRAGYRTAAVTDSGYVSRTFGMDRGFEWFEEQRHDGRPLLPRTLASANALLDEDDGRPLFLFVHTYRTHWPYRKGAEEDSDACHALKRKSDAEIGLQPPSDLPALKVFADAFHELYRDGARALDQGLGPWFAGLEARGLFTRGLFLFTSDHGEEFLDSGTLLHGGEPHEALAHVPLFVFGGGEPARAVTRPVSLIDLAPTLAARAGIAPDPRWVGSDLFAREEEPAAERTLFASVRRRDDHYVALWRGAHKLTATAKEPVRLPANLTGAYDLAVDPNERTNLLESAPWAAALARETAPLWDAIREPLGERHDVALDPAQADDLQRLGY